MLLLHSRSFRQSRVLNLKQHNEPRHSRRRRRNSRVTFEYENEVEKLQKGWGLAPADSQSATSAAMRLIAERSFGMR